jgi:alpha-L-fucosidase
MKKIMTVLMNSSSSLQSMRKKMISRSFLLIILIFIVMFLPSCESQKAPLTKDQRMEWWREAKFGMFIHWGVYAIPAGVWQGQEIPGIGEWIMAGADIPIPEYEKLPPQFNPVKYDASEWVKIAQDAGMKYMVITSKHHDGFALFDSKVSDYDVVDRTPYQKDILKPLSEACEEAGIKFATYHSILDWHHPAQKLNDDPQYAGKRWSYSRNMIKEGRKDEFIGYMKGQLEEIINQYDPAIMWFDGGWMDWWTLEDGKPVLDFLWQLKPELIINNRATKDSIDIGLGDYGTPEQRIPEKGLDYDWETCMTMNDTWGFKQNDHNWKSTQVLIINLVDVVSKGGNLLLNVGPTAEGLIPQPSIDRLREMGKWLTVNGEAIYGTKMWRKYKEGPHDVITRYYDLDMERTVPYTAQDIRFTAKDKVIYASCLAWPEEEVKILSLGKESAPDIEIENVSMLGSDENIKWQAAEEQLTLIPPKNKPCEHVFVFKISIK